MSTSSLFAQLNQSINANPLNKEYNFGVEGQPASAMDTVNPMLRNAVQGGVSAFGGNMAPVQTSQEKAAEKQALHRKELSRQASALGLHDLAKSIATGDIDNKSALGAIQKHKDAEAEKAASQLAHDRAVEMAQDATNARITEKSLEREQEVADRKEDRAFQVEDAKTEADRLAEKREYQTVGGRVFLLDGNGKKLQDLGMSEDAIAKADKVNQEQALNTVEYQNTTDQANIALNSLDQLKQIVDEEGMDSTTSIIGSIYKGGSAGDVVTAFKDIKAKMGAAALALAKSGGNGSSGYGSLSESEMVLLQDSIAALEPGISDAAMARATETIRHHFNLAKKRVSERNVINGKGDLVDGYGKASEDSAGGDLDAALGRY